MPVNEELYEQTKIDESPLPDKPDNTQRVELMAADLEAHKVMRKAFKRRRVVDPDAPGIHVSMANRQFNDRLYKYYGSFVKDLGAKDSKPSA